MFSAKWHAIASSLFRSTKNGVVPVFPNSQFPAFREFNDLFSTRQVFPRRIKVACLCLRYHSFHGKYFNKLSSSDAAISDLYSLTTSTCLYQPRFLRVPSPKASYKNRYFFLEHTPVWMLLANVIILSISSLN